MFAVIFAGGSGTRLWPVSRQNSPKQVNPFIDDESLLQKTYDRIGQFFNNDKIFISTNYLYQDLILKEQQNMPFYITSIFVVSAQQV